jgi:hypothetical protein
LPVKLRGAAKLFAIGAARRFEVRRVTRTGWQPPWPMEKILRDVRPNQVESDNPPNSRAKAVLVFYS